MTFSLLQVYVPIQSAFRLTYSADEGSRTNVVKLMLLGATWKELTLEEFLSTPSTAFPLTIPSGFCSYTFSGSDLLSQSSHAIFRAQVLLIINPMIVILSGIFYF